MSQDLLNEARRGLAEIAKDPDRYSKLLEGLVLQVQYSAEVKKNTLKPTGLLVLFVLFFL